MRKEVKDFVAKCLTYQTIEYSTEAPNGLLQPLEMPERVWEDLALDFIVSLPTFRGNSTILMVINGLMKYTHFGALSANYTTSKVVELFTHMVIRLHATETELRISSESNATTSQQEMSRHPISNWGLGFGEASAIPPIYDSRCHHRASPPSTIQLNLADSPSQLPPPPSISPPSIAQLNLVIADSPLTDSRCHHQASPPSILKL
ncbi:hypothetical protein FEM48_Zijuj10G0075100 [Ziziphus jujuba var. spinosa]|uniref:Uncharacterized protein n=1 Tax=Ziziphus jujuba var. spinosa TaxID=714518 RepID=A0A978UM44_ZIZJJ|nr:hypothetical protein FEM48_Zijuj10G0075100 [Ziziphus jujuba var. spinosa]